ncbi:hypothetical protein OEZ85_008897 [Tetradesmus obliquus]|uniref:Uncharacterized protein n=1 Tax=Tetradesmus obliquus TaxID=3088 RepID=A0ABY8TM53_TETOB|nr:hypothetical protein OEZ85_008897 [Tetradesmus obliquus]
MAFHRLCPVCSRSFPLVVTVKADNVQVGINNPTNLPYVCPTCTCARCSSNTCADPCSSSQANPPTPNKTETQVPLVPVTIDLGATPAANTEPFPAPVYQAHSTGPGVPACGKFYQYVLAAAIAHCSRGSSSNPIAVEDADISKLLQDPVATASINKVEDAFYKAHPEVAAKFQKKPLSAAAAAAAAADHEQPAAKVAKGAPEDSPGSIAAAAAAAAAAAVAAAVNKQMPPAACRIEVAVLFDHARLRQHAYKAASCCLQALV